MSEEKMSEETLSGIQVRVVRKNKPDTTLIIKQIEGEKIIDLCWFMDIMNMIAENPPENVNESDENCIVIEKPIHNQPMWMKRDNEPLETGERISLTMYPFDAEEFDCAV